MFFGRKLDTVHREKTKGKTRKEKKRKENLKVTHKTFYRKKILSLTILPFYCIDFVNTCGCLCR